MRVVLDGVFNHTGRGFFPFHDVLENGADSPYLDWFTVYGTPDQRLRPEPAPGLRGLVAPPRPAQAEHRQPGGAGVPDGGGRALDPARGRRLAPRRARGDHHRRASGRSSARACGRSTPRPTWWGRSGTPRPSGPPRGDRFDGVMNYVLTEAVLRFAAGGRIDPHVVAPVNLTLQPALDAAGYRRGHRPPAGHLPGGGPPGQPEPAGVARHPAGAEHGGGGPGLGDPGGRCCSSPSAGRRASTTGTRSGMTGHHDPGARGAFPWERPDVLGPGDPARPSAAWRRCGGSTRPCGGGPTGTWRPRAALRLLPGGRRGVPGGGGQRRGRGARRSPCGAPVAGGPEADLCLGPGRGSAGGDGALRLSPARAAAGVWVLG